MGDNKRVLLTGASGFIGSHCIAGLLARGYEVHAVARRTPPDARGAIWHEADLLQPGVGTALAKRIEPTHLLHLAWFVVPGKLISSPENFAWVTASMDLLQGFAAHGGKRFVACGSAYEYDWSYGYCSEKLTPATPNTVYGACKQALRLMAESFAAQAGLSAAWGRVFFLYGPNEHPDRLVSSVIRSVLKGAPARCSHGRQIRDYMHVQDVADGLMALLDSDVSGTVNVASGQATTIRDIVLAAGRLMGRPELIHLGALPARANDAPLVVGDNTRLVSEVGWTQQLDLEAGLNHTIEWWKAQERISA
jgi:nucleoside-diphosphate-sugar epimerase